MPPPLLTAASRVPSLEEAMESQVPFGTTDGVQVAPALVEVEMPPPLTAAASRVPSLEEAMEYQFAPGALDCVQFMPAAPVMTELTTKLGTERKTLVAGSAAKVPMLP